MKVEEEKVTYGSPKQAETRQAELGCPGAMIANEQKPRP